MTQHSIKYKSLFLLLFGSALMLAPLLVVAQNYHTTNPSIKAFLKINPDKITIDENNSIAIIGAVKNLDNDTVKLRYELSVTVSNKKTNAISMNGQSGYFILNPYDTQDLSQTFVLTDSDSQSIVLLAIYKGSILLGKIKKVYGSTE